jgi:hypothetical protein
MRRLLLIFCVIAISVGIASGQQKFIHPGVLHTADDFRQMELIIKSQSGLAYQSYLLLKNDPKAAADYRMNGPFRVISRDGEFAYTKSKMEADFSAAYLNAIMWMLSHDPAHAEKSLSILTAYADSLKEIPSTNDAPLLAGLEGFKIVYATELLKYTYPSCKPASIAKITGMIRNLFLPVLDTFYSRPPYTNGNWGSIVTKTYMAAAILLDNRQMYNRAKQFYLHANDNGTIANYIDRETGQVQESGRDQGHSQLGLGAMATVCEEAYKQGDDLYEALDNRLLKGFEYVARYNLGDDTVPFKTWKDVTGKYSSWATISSLSRGKFMPVYQMAYHHYVILKGLKMPYTQRIIQQTGPEGYDRDQPGFGTFLFADQIKD